MNIKKLALIGSLASALSGCVAYDTGNGVTVAPLAPTPVIVTPTPAVVTSAFLPLWWAPCLNYYCR